MKEIDKRDLPSFLRKKFEEGFMYLNVTGKDKVSFDITPIEVRIFKWKIRSTKV